MLWFLLVYGAEITAHNSTAWAWEGQAREEGVFSSCLNHASALLWRRGIKPGSNLEMGKKKIYLSKFTKMDQTGFSEASLRSIHFSEIIIEH